MDIVNIFLQWWCGRKRCGRTWRESHLGKDKVSFNFVESSTFQKVGWKYLWV